jgi:hypothetical protein
MEVKLHIFLLAALDQCVRFEVFHGDDYEESRLLGSGAV